MLEKKVKIQFTLPESLIEKINKETQETYTNKSLWFKKVVSFYFEYMDAKKNKKIIDLDI